MKGRGNQLRGLKLGGLLCLVLTIFLVGCGGASTSSGTATSNAGSTADYNASKQASSSNASGSSKSSAPTNYTPQYLIKQLNVTMEAKDTNSTANDLQNWITSTDTRASSSGMQYQLNGDTYTISITFSVQASDYTQIQRYLVDYPAKHNGRLLSLNESVQNATNDYIDTQSRLKNLRVEQQRLQDLMKNAQSMSDVLSINSQLSDVEGQIEQAEGHLNALSDQTTFYPISITIQPPGDGSATPTASSGNNWNAGQIAHDAFQASLHFFQFLVSILIWLLAFSIYIIPTLILIWLYRRWRRGRQVTNYRPQRLSTPPPAATLHTQQPVPETVHPKEEEPAAHVKPGEQAEGEEAQPVVNEEELPIS
ncbi:DUF4349 domain-containing protein [Ktedonobacter racemifer]|uniref:DUF4349 domain-containing protein n=1 Tax=Ktedonobacter racemifer DSM 44963 TaxID=485913 RepID=D6U6R8_KTERA|nr:DUF4349 domain-containing protein [Ktedonobacter racemifer]EFH80679.1 hypothetical protein Krac_1295 [Ktedonobacter racemifer DSM 44963]